MASEARIRDAAVIVSAGKFLVVDDLLLSGKRDDVLMVTGQSTQSHPDMITRHSASVDLANIMVNFNSILIQVPDFLHRCNRNGILFELIFDYGGSGVTICTQRCDPVSWAYVSLQGQ